MDDSAPRAPYASLAMYPFESTIAAWDTLWRAVHREAPWTPPTLSWTGDVQADWRSTACVVSQACGWPIATQLGAFVEVIGAFSFTIAEARGHEYHSILIARDPHVLERVGDADLIAAVNSADSLSGCVSLLASIGRAAWPGLTRWTGSHAESVRAVSDGTADVASIDSLSLRFITREQPALIEGLHRVGAGPWVPSPAIVVRQGTSTARRRELVRGLRAAASDPALGAALQIDGFVELDTRAYEAVSRLVPAG
jgi:ABC-type phosphate/phosphonate transport system substrate-binding protein